LESQEFQGTLKPLHQRGPRTLQKFPCSTQTQNKHYITTSNIKTTTYSTVPPPIHNTNAHISSSRNQHQHQRDPEPFQNNSTINNQFTTKQANNVTSSTTLSPTPNLIHHRTPNTSRPENTLQQQSQL
jgi:hypothetical protein